MSQLTRMPDQGAALAESSGLACNSMVQDLVRDIAGGVLVRNERPLIISLVNRESRIHSTPPFTALVADGEAVGAAAADLLYGRVIDPNHALGFTVLTCAVDAAPASRWHLSFQPCRCARRTSACGSARRSSRSAATQRPRRSPTFPDGGGGGARGRIRRSGKPCGEMEPCRPKGSGQGLDGDRERKSWRKNVEM